MNEIRELLDRIHGKPSDAAPFTPTGRPGEVNITGVGIRRIKNLEQTPLYYGVTVPPGLVSEGATARLQLFDGWDPPADPLVTNILYGNRLSTGTEAIIYRIRIGFAPEADLTMADILGLTSTAKLYLKFMETVEVTGGLAFFPFAWYAGNEHSELTELLPSDEGMTGIDEGASGARSFPPPPPPPEDTAPPVPVSRRYIHHPSRMAIPIHVFDGEGAPQFAGDLTFRFRSKNTRPVTVYVIMDSLLRKPLR